MNQVKPKISPHARTAARQRALQALYQWNMTAQDIKLIEEQFLSEQDMRRTDLSYFQRLLHGVPGCVTELDTTIAHFLDRHINRLDPVEHTILRIGCYELYHCLEDVPWRVAIDEAVELAKKFGAEQSHKYVNSILDKIAHGLLQNKATLKDTCHLRNA